MKNVDNRLDMKLHLIESKIIKMEEVILFLPT